MARFTQPTTGDGSGLPGAQGDPGAPGSDGLDSLFLGTWNSVTEFLAAYQGGPTGLADGDWWAFVKDNTDPNKIYVVREDPNSATGWVIDDNEHFVLPAGPQGDPGAEGADGEDGAPGERGTSSLSWTYKIDVTNSGLDRDPGNDYIGFATLPFTSSAQILVDDNPFGINTTLHDLFLGIQSGYLTLTSQTDPSVYATYQFFSSVAGTATNETSTGSYVVFNLSSYTGYGSFIHDELVTLSISIAGPQGEPGADGADGADAIWNFTGEYDGGASYAIGDVVTYDGQLWYRTHANGGTVGNTPSEGFIWALLAAKGADGNNADIADFAFFQEGAEWENINQNLFTSVMAITDHDMRLQTLKTDSGVDADINLVSAENIYMNAQTSIRLVSGTGAYLGYDIVPEKQIATIGDLPTGATGTFNTTDAKIVTVTNGIITSIESLA